MKWNGKAGGWLFCLAMCWVAPLFAQKPSLKVTYGPLGVEQVAYRGQVVEDVKRWPEDAFHVWHMKAMRGDRVEASGQYGWGENNNSRSWDPGAKAWTYEFVWGSLRTAYAQRGDTLDVTVTLTNRLGSGVVMDGASVYALSLHGLTGGTQLMDGRMAPGISIASWGAAAGEVAVVAPDAAKPVYSGFQEGKAGAVNVLVSGTRPDALGGQGAGRSVAPGQSDTVKISIRFASAGTPPERVASDAYTSWRMQWPQQLAWPDRRIIGSVYLASSAQGDKTLRAGFGSNPRRYFSDGNPADFNVRNADGLRRFQVRVLDQAAAVVKNLQRMHAQGMITWDIEGQEYPQDTSYICAPDAVAKAAPEMESVVGAGAPYAGMKLDDAYFKIVRDAGFRVGVCVRPQRFELGNDGRARQVTLPDNQVAAELIRKMRYAHDRWGATLFYLDSTVDANGRTLDAGVLEQAAAAMPGSLVIPEESSTRMYRAMAPFATFLFHGDTGTAAQVRALYPKAFSVNLINDVDAGKLEAHRTELIQSVRRGDVLMVHAGYWQNNNATVINIYQAAGREP